MFNRVFKYISDLRVLCLEKLIWKLWRKWNSNSCKFLIYALLGWNLQILFLSNAFFVYINDRLIRTWFWYWLDQLNSLVNVWFSASLQFSTTQKMKFSNKGFFSKCDPIRSFLRIWSHLLKKSLMKNFIFCSVYSQLSSVILSHTLPQPSVPRVFLNPIWLETGFSVRTYSSLFF